MGTIFVLLLGEIDLSIGTASGVCAVTMALSLTNKGDLDKALGTGTYIVLLAFMVVGLAITFMYKLWIPFAIIALGLIFIVTHYSSHQVAAMLVAIAVGCAIGIVIGFLVAHVGIPSFIVTLALFLAWQGVLLKFIGSSNAISTRQFNLINKIENGNIKPALAWIMWAAAMIIYGVFVIGRALHKRAQKLTGEPIDLAILRVVVLVVATGAAVFVLNQNRALTVFATLEGVPWVVAIVAIVFVGLNIVLTKQRYGRYIYATGGNTEAARRAGIDVRRHPAVGVRHRQRHGRTGRHRRILATGRCAVRLRRPHRPAVRRRCGGHRRYVAVRWSRQAARRHHRCARHRDDPERPRPEEPGRAVRVHDHRPLPASRGERRRHLAQTLHGQVAAYGTRSSATGRDQTPQSGSAPGAGSP